MDDIVVRRLEGDSQVEAEPLWLASWQDRLRNGEIVFAASCNGRICGALGAVEEDGNRLSILSLYVEESFRRRGIGSLLLDEAAEYAKRQQLGELALSYSCFPKEAEGIDQFLLNNGFTLPRAGEVLYFLSLSSLENSYFASLPEMRETGGGQIIPLHEIPKRKIRKYMMYAQEDAIEHLLPQNAVGKVLEDISLLYFKEEEITAFLIMSEVDGSLHLNSAFVKEAGMGKYLLMLLQAALETVREKYAHYDTMTVTGANEGGRSLIESLLSGAQVTYKTAYTASKPLVLGGVAVPAGYEGVLVRFQALTAYLAQRGIGSAIVMLPGCMPYMELDIDGTKEPLGLHYEVLESEDDSYKGFRMIAELKLPVKGLDPNGREELCSQIDNEDSPCYTICTDEGEVLLRAVAAWEEGAFRGEVTVDGFISPVMTYCTELISTLA